MTVVVTSIRLTGSLKFKVLVEGSHACIGSLIINLYLYRFKYRVSSCLRGPVLNSLSCMFLICCSHLVVSMLMWKQFIGTPTLLLYLMKGFSTQTSYLRRHVSPLF